MKKIKLDGLIKYLPEIALIGGGTTFIILDIIKKTTSMFTLSTALCTLLVILLLIWKNKYLAIFLSILLGLLSIFFLFALFSEFNEFPSVNEDAMHFLQIGVLLFGSLLVTSTLLPLKYFRNKES